MPKTLYAKLAAALVALFIAVGLLYAVLSTSATQSYVQEVNQRFNKDLARNLVADRNLVEQGRINEAALKETFHMYMVINPSIEIYLLDLEGTILSYSADPGKVKRKHVGLGPIHAFLDGDRGYPLLGDDPRSHDRRKAFSVTPVPAPEKPEGYLYVVLRGEEFDAVNRVLTENYFLRLSSWAVAGSLAFGLLAGLVLFRVLTRRMQRLAGVMDHFDRSNFTEHTPYRPKGTGASDEIDRLGATFDQMAGRIIAQLDELQSKDAQRRDLVAQVSHDLRTPLASLRGYLESLMLKNDELSDAQRTEYIRIALRHSERLSRLVAELFELAKLDARETEPAREAFAPAELVQDVVQKFELMASAKDVALHFEFSDNLPFAAADIAMTERALEKLVENALEYTPSGGQILLSVKQDGANVRIAVEDTGCGVAQEDLPHIFEPFYQSSSARDDGARAGLGLAIARRIVELNEGEIQVASEVGRGTKFSFSLPVRRH